jgi:CRISPR-associated endonuclease/helicase Cas3
VKLIQDNLKPLRRRFRRLERDKNVQPYMLMNYTFSLLIDADKSEVVLNKLPERPSLKIDYTVVDEYKATLDIRKSY